MPSSRNLATIHHVNSSEVTGYPVGREGPTARCIVGGSFARGRLLILAPLAKVTMGSNLAYLITSGMALPFVREGHWKQRISFETDDSIVRPMG